MGVLMLIMATRVCLCVCVCMYVYVSQTDSGSSVMGASLHSQKIARAKWEFLFGTSSGEGAEAGRKGNNTQKVLG